MVFGLSTGEMTRLVNGDSRRWESLGGAEVRRLRFRVVENMKVPRERGCSGVIAFRCRFDSLSAASSSRRRFALVVSG